MLQKLNEGIQGILAWVIIILVSVTFALFGVDYYLQSRHTSSNVVTVNDQPITKQELELAIRRARQARDPAEITADAEQQLQKQALDALVTNALSVQAAHEYGFSVHQEQTNAAILSIPQFQQDGHFSTQRYQQVLSSAFFTPESFLQEVHQGMLLNQQRFAFIGTSFVLPSEMKRFVKLYMQTRNYDYLNIPVKPFVNEAKITDKEANAYYQQHKSEFIAPEEVIIEYVRLSMQDIKSHIKISEEQLKQYYDANQGNFTTPAQWRVAHILFSVPGDATAEEKKDVEEKAQQIHQELLDNPALFDEKLKAHSDDMISVKKQGLLPWITAGQTSLDKVLLNLIKPGQISEPVKTGSGYEIFKLVEYKAPQLKTFVQVKSDIRQQLLADQVQSEYNQALEALSDLSYQTPDTLTPVAEALNLKIEQSKAFSREGGDSSMTQNQQVINTAFSHDVLEIGNNSEPLQVNDDSVIVLRVKKHISSKQKTFSDVKAKIMARLTEEKAQEQAKSVGKKILSLKYGSKAQETLLNQYDLAWQDINQATRETDKAPTPINELAFNLARIGEAKGITLDNGHYALVYLKGIDEGQLKSLDKEQVASIKQQLEASNGVISYDLYVNKLLEKAKIVDVKK